DGPPPVDESDKVCAVVIGTHEIAGFLDRHLVPGCPRHARERRRATIAQLGRPHPRHAPTALKAVPSHAQTLSTRRSASRSWIGRPVCSTIHPNWPTGFTSRNTC